MHPNVENIFPTFGILALTLVEKIFPIFGTLSLPLVITPGHFNAVQTIDQCPSVPGGEKY